ncbi:MAG: site-2 protease family protein [Anaerolineales bacterium]|nr:site-2 protease family protein [Anaerolineales bacterium]
MENRDRVKQILAEIGDLIAVEDITTDFMHSGAFRFRGQLQIPEKEAIQRLNQRMEPFDLIPILRRVDGQDVLLLTPYQPVEQAGKPVSTGKPWVNLVLFIATVFTVLMAGMQQSTGNLLADILSGWPFAVGLLGILLTHEFGHYFASKYHGIPASLPYFLPMPLSPLGTFGAVIINRGRMRNRRVLLDIGAAGPLAGLIVSFPVLLIGLALSTVEPLAGQCSAANPCMMEGNSLLYLGIKYLVFGRILPGNGLDVMIHPVAFAGWAGMLVTALNLLPVGTLDGGHVAYALLGNKARYLYMPILVALIGMGFMWNGWWLWAGLLFFFGRMRAEPIDDVTPLDGKRKVIAVIALLAFVLTFSPIPLTFIM